MSDPHHPDLEKAMMKPDFYPHPVSEVKRVETHISIVFLAGEVVYKIKKPVDLDFLDFSDLKKRHRFCQEEVRLNQRLSRDVYHGVVPITEDEGRLSLEGDGNPVEYAVKMRRLDDAHIMSRMLDRNALKDRDLEELTVKLSDFYRSVPAGSEVGGWQTVQKNCEENFEQMAPFVDEIITVDRFDLIQAATRGFLQARHLLFETRSQDGCIREGHGDLRSEHIYFTPAGIQIIDCIEFNERMRYNDVASDIGFLCMDLDVNGAFAAANQILNDFVLKYEDLQMLSLIDFYRCYRACVRLKVTCFRLGQKDVANSLRKRLQDRIDTFTDLACRYARRFARPTVYVVMGMIASGKSTVAARLAETVNAEVLSTDCIRREIFENRGDTAGREFGEGIYQPQARSLVYGKMMLKAQEWLHRQLPIILDATFDNPDRRQEAIRLAANCDAHVVFIECTCPEAVIRKRLAERENNRTESDARLSILDRFKNAYQPPEEIPKHLLYKADTTQPVEKLIVKLFMATRDIYQSS